jgi:hypothetical protein
MEDFSDLRRQCSEYAGKKQDHGNYEASETFLKRIAIAENPQRHCGFSAIIQIS